MPLTIGTGRALLGGHKDPLTVGVAAYWPCQEGSGSTLHDVSGNGHDAVFNGTWTTGHVGASAAAFTPAQYAQIPFSAALNFDSAQPWSFNVWVTQANNTDAAHVLFSTMSGTIQGYEVGFNTTSLRVYLVNAWTANAITVSAIAGVVNTWQMVTVTYDGSLKAAGVTLYFNGSPLPPTIEHDTLTGSIHTSNPPYLSSRAQSFGVNGALGQAGMWPRTITPADIIRLYAAGAGLNPFGS